LFLEIKFEILKIIMLNAVLRGSIFFLILYLPAAFFGIMDMWKYSVYILVVLAGMYSVILAIRQYRQIRYKLLEEREPELQDILTTAHDTMDEENVMVRAMWRELAMKVRKIRPVMFFEPGQIVKWVFVIFVLSVLTAMSPTLTYQLAKHNVTTDSFKLDINLPDFFDGPGINNGDIAAVDIFQDDSIFGDRSPIILGDDELTFEIDQDFSGIDFSSEDDLLNENFDENDDLTQIFIPKGTGFDAKKAAANSKQQKIWIKNYFEAIDK